MPGFGWHPVREIAACKGVCFHFQINLGVNVCGVKGDMSEPGANGIDVHAGTEHMDGTRMSNAMRADQLLRERWQGLTRLYNGAADETIDAETR